MWELTTSSIPNTFLDSDSDPTRFTVHRNQSGVSAPHLPSSSRTSNDLTSPPLIQSGDRTRLLRAVAMTTEKRSRHIPRGLARGFPGNSHTNPGKHPEKTLGRPPDRGITAGLVHSSGYLQEKKHDDSPSSPGWQRSPSKTDGGKQNKKHFCNTVGRHQVGLSFSLKTN